jgi:putative glutamine amidotransferase
MPRIAIPTPTSFDLAYNRLNWPAYSEAVAAAGGEAVEVPLGLDMRQVAELAASCQGILLPGSPADVDPARFGQQRDPATAPADLPREQVDELLLDHASAHRKPVLGICFGAQMLNVWRGGALVQDVTILPVNHAAARGVSVAHTALVPLGSLLAGMVSHDEASLQDGFLRLAVNSSHHQAVGILGDGLRVAARCPQDGVVEAIEMPGGEAAERFVLGIQWHPERTVGSSATSRAIFGRLVREAAIWSSLAEASPVASAVVVA